MANYLVAQTPVPQNPAPQSWQDEGSYVWEYEYRKGLSLKMNHQRTMPHLGELIVAGAGAGTLAGGHVAGPVGAAAGAAVGTAIVCTGAAIQKVSGDVKEVLLAREFRKAAVDMAKTGQQGRHATRNSQSTVLSRTQENRRRDARHAPTTQSGQRELSDRGNQRQIDYRQSSEDDSDSGSGQSHRRQLSDRGNQKRLVYHQSSEDDSDDWGSHSDRRQLSGRSNRRRNYYV